MAAILKTTSTIHDPMGASRTALTRLTELLANFAMAMAAHHRAATAMDELHAKSDDRLRDIGILRCDIARAARYGRHLRWLAIRPAHIPLLCALLGFLARPKQIKESMPPECRPRTRRAD